MTQATDHIPVTRGESYPEILVSLQVRATRRPLDASGATVSVEVSRTGGVTVFTTADNTLETIDAAKGRFSFPLSAELVGQLKDGRQSTCRIWIETGEPGEPGFERTLYGETLFEVTE